MGQEDKKVGSLTSLANETEFNIPLKLREFLSENNACYVLITCGKPSKEGKMHVEMSYEGDECLAAYLIESAQEILQETL